MKLTTLFGLGLLLCLCLRAAETKREIGRNSKQIFSAVGETLRGISNTRFGREDWPKIIIEQCSSDLVVLQKKASGDLSYAYLINLNDDHHALTLVEKAARDADKIGTAAEKAADTAEKLARELRRLFDVALDIKAMIKDFKDGLGIKTPYETAKIIVHTRRPQATADERDLYVVYALRAVADQPDKFHSRFDQPSSPTDQDLAPGGYVLWVTDLSGRRRSANTYLEDVGATRTREITILLR